MANLETRGQSVRVQWRLGGAASGARQSCTFSGETVDAAMALAELADSLLKSRNHNMTRMEVYDAILGPADAEADDSDPLTFKDWVNEWIEDRTRMRDIQPDVILSYQRILKARAIPFLG